MSLVDLMYGEVFCMSREYLHKQPPYSVSLNINAVEESKTS